MINRYEGGEKPGHHAWHVDTGGHHLTQERKLSIVIALSPPGSYAGGDLQLLDGSSEFPLSQVGEGIGVVFHSLMLHRVLPIHGDGVRYSCVLWLMGPRFE
jgi:predicted 2-oxoglutarate/Fe(II)-dependent dioxygenase YbiX